MDKLSYSYKYEKMKHKYLQLKKLKELIGGNPKSYADITKMLGNSRLISKGSYGCVYSPPLKCDHLNCSDLKCLTGISKLMNYGAAIKELNNYINLNIDAIDKDLTYHIGTPHLCRPTLSEVPQSCSFIEKPLAILIYENGGMDAYKLFLKIGDQSEPFRTYNLKVFIKELKKLLLGLKIFHDNRIAHFDIKLDNIVTGMSDKFNYITNCNFRLIDFGLSLNYKCEFNISNIFNGLNGMEYDLFQWHFNNNGSIFSYYPVDLYLVSFLKNKKLNEDELEELKKYISAYLENLLDSYKTYNYIVNTYSKSEFSADNIYTVLVKLLNRPFDKIIMRIIQTIESYQFGILLLDILVSFPQYKKQIESFLDRTKILHYNPFERMPVGQLNEHFSYLNL